MCIQSSYTSVYNHTLDSENATTLFEEFQKPGSRPNSKNHHFFGDISSWFFKYIAGVKINPHETNVREIEISPNFIDGLENADGYQYHLGGKISSKWQKASDGYEVTVSIPEGCYGKLIAPNGHIILENGDYRNHVNLTSNETIWKIVKK